MILNLRFIDLFAGVGIGYFGERVFNVNYFIRVQGFLLYKKSFNNNECKKYKEIINDLQHFISTIKHRIH